MNRELLDMLDELQEKRSLVVSYEEFTRASEFLILHESEFKVTNIHDDFDMITITLI